MSVQVVAELGSGVFQIQETELERCCVRCLGAVVDGFGWFECECGCSFYLAVVGAFNLNGGSYLLVDPALPEPQPEAEA